MISEVLSLTSTESPAYAAMALICFTARALKRYHGAITFTGGESNVRAFPQLLKMYIKSHKTCLCCAILFCGGGDAVVKGIKGRGGDTRNCTRLIQIFASISFLRNTLNSISILSGSFLPRSRVGRPISIKIYTKLNASRSESLGVVWFTSVLLPFSQRTLSFTGAYSTIYPVLLQVRTSSTGSVKPIIICWGPFGCRPSWYSSMFLDSQGTKVC